MANMRPSPSIEDPGIPFAEPGGEERVRLLAIAREAIGARLGAGPRQASKPGPGEARVGAFVTLTIGGRLRGCIGRMESKEPVSKTIARMAEAAAFEDPRFRPLSASEFDKISIEITLLGPRRQIQSSEAIELGRHGVWMQKGYSSAVFLPQVAVEQGWDRATLLKELSLKAGLGPSAWQDADTTLMVFEGYEFGES